MCTRALWAVVAALFLVSTCDASSSTVSITLPSSVPSTLNAVRDDFAGISLEFNVLDFLIGPAPNAIPTAMKNYLTNLRSRISSQFRLRVGGNSLDGSFYDPNAAQMITFNLPAIGRGIKNVPVTFGPQVLTTLNRLGSDVGGISHLLGLSLVYPQNDSNVVKFAQDAQTVIGSNLDAFLLGNEPDLYKGNHKRPANYTVVDYSADLNKVARDLRQGNAASALGAPSTCCNRRHWALTEILNLTFHTDVNKQLKYTSLQHYPQQSCNSKGSSRWNITYFTNHANVQQLVKWQSDGIAMALDAGKEVIMDEFNTAACGGEPGRSDTFAAALWTVDFVLGLAGNGYTAAYLHTREPGISYNIFTYPNTSSASNTGWVTGPQYYSLLLLAETFSTKQTTSGGTVVVDLNLDNPAAVAGYAIYDVNALTAPPRNLVLFNFASDSSAQTFTLPSGLAPSQKLNTYVRTLTASSLTENNAAKITYAGQTVDGSGSLRGKLSEKKVTCQNGCDVEVPGPGIALVMLQAQKSSARRQRTAGFGSGGSVELAVVICLGSLAGYLI